MTDKKKNKYNTWTEPKIVGPKPKRRPSTSVPSKAPVARKAEAQRRGMAATRKKAQAKRPAPMTMAQLQAVKDRDLDAAAKAARKRARKR